MPMSSRACPLSLPPTASLRPSRLAIREADDPVEMAGTLIPAAWVESVLADAPWIASVTDAATAASAAATPAARRLFALLVKITVLPNLGRRLCAAPSQLNADRQARPRDAVKLTVVRMNRVG